MEQEQDVLVQDNEQTSLLENLSEKAEAFSQQDANVQVLPTQDNEAEKPVFEFDFETGLESEKLNVLGLHETILNTRMDDFNFETHGQYAQKIMDVLHEKIVQLNCAGLSANQLGIPARVFAYGNSKFCIAMFNPEIKGISKANEEMREGCMSFPGLILKIRRPRAVAVKWQDENGNEQTGTFGGMEARVILHELDHLNGVTFMQRTTPYRVMNAINSLSAKIQKMNKRNEAYERLYKQFIDEQTPKAEKEDPTTAET